MSVLQTPHSHFESSDVKIYCLENCIDMIKHVILQQLDNA